MQVKALRDHNLPRKQSKSGLIQLLALLLLLLHGLPPGGCRRQSLRVRERHQPRAALIACQLERQTDRKPPSPLEAHGEAPDKTIAGLCRRAEYKPNSYSD